MVAVRKHNHNRNRLPDISAMCYDSISRRNIRA
jgi:hypothetical protein